MQNFICTYGRSKRQVTWNNLPLEIQQKTVLVVQHREKALYEGYPKLVLPEGIETIGKTRQFLVEMFKVPFCMMDDDIVFATRRADIPSKFVPSTQPDIINLYGQIRDLLFEVPLVGVAGREGAHTNTHQFLRCTRQMRVHGVDPVYFNAHSIRYDRMELMEDFDVILQILEEGDQNIVINGFVTNQSGSNTEGGCSAYRTLAKQAEAANLLHTLHPHYVKVVQKKTKTSWGGQERTDVVVAWKSAYKDGLKNADRNRLYAVSDEYVGDTESGVSAGADSE